MASLRSIIHRGDKCEASKAIASGMKRFAVNLSPTIAASLSGGIWDRTMVNNPARLHVLRSDKMTARGNFLLALKGSAKTASNPMSGYRMDGRGS